ncbi:CIC11C00000001650 [Sungouiella intermedia]|uniref:Heat shock transcription factor n=1 Tax=Sungouiella intermedia TaxID=45354 RepID=A0A1L0BV58_9ASCO|nr:CIC11C00000001650 [[Candida] intermedia]
MPMVPDYMSNGVSSRQALIGAVKKKKDQGPKTRPAFVLKVWNMVNDPANHDYIRWTDDGEAFVVVHREEFMKLILPNYFKHNNFASFVRQLNMYGWHKVQDVTSGTMKEGSNLDDAFQFKNPDFIRGREDLLDNIVRNKSNLEEDNSLVNLQVMTTEVDKLKMTQLAMLEDLRRIRADNQNLWQEIVNARDRERKLSQMIQKIVNFVEAAYGKSAGKIFEVQNGPHDANNQVLAFNNQAKQGYRNNPQGNNIYSPSPTPVQRPRLMLMDLTYQKTPSDTRSPSSTWKDGSVEEIVRNGEDYDSNNKFLQQFMNQEPVDSPRHFFPELQNNYFGNQDSNDNFQKLEQKLQDHGNDLAHTQEWIDQISKQQQQQQQQLQQLLKSPSNADSGIDDFMSEILNDPADSIKREDSSSSATGLGSKRLMNINTGDNGGSSRKRARR